MTQPQAFGHYELLDRVSAGGMAEVFRARDTTRGTIVALKRILPSIAKDEDFVQMFEDEARIASQLEHPHIARTFDFGHVGESFYIAFEYVDGKDLRVIFDRCVRSKERPPLPLLLYMFTRIGEGLSYAHSRRDAGGEPVLIVHRDVSPQNIVISYGGDVKLIDFGIAKAAGKLSRTEVGAIKGKFGYMSPEQVGGAGVDQRTDVFSLGICMWELLTLKRLYDAPNEVLVLDKIRNTKVEPPSSLNPAVPPELDRIVCKALAKDVDERYRSAKELYRDLNSLSKDTNTVATREQIAQYMRRTFQESGQPPVPSTRVAGGGVDLADATTPSTSRVQETDMAAENKGGSDLDVFEGLGKKASVRPPSAAPSSGRNGPPPPPPTLRNSDVPPHTLRGLNSGPLPGGSTPPPLRSPPPPPGRSALPPVVPPPSRAPTSASFPVAATPKPRPQGAKLDMDWDDENEATHVFDKEQSKSEPPPRPPPPSSSMPVSRPPPPPSSLSAAKRTLVGVGTQSPFQAPPPPPPPPGPPPSMQPGFRTSATPPPPPSSVGGAFARASSLASAAPGPVAYPPPPPPPTIDPRPTPAAVPVHNAYAPPYPQALPPQTSTVPLPMPGPRPSARPQMPDMPPPPNPNRMEATALVIPTNRSNLGPILGIVTALLVIGAAAVYFLTPRKGDVTVSATDARGDALHIEVYVDGKKTDCGTSPCTVRDVPVGSHSVKVVAEGALQEQSVDVVSGQQVRASFVVGATAAGSGVAGETATGVKAEGSQPGVKLYVDDKEVGPLPAEVRDLAPGSHHIRVAGGDRYTPIEKNVTVAKDEFQDLGTLSLKVVKGKATISPGTPGAKVYIVSGSDRRELPTLPISVDIDTSKQWSLLATKPGYNDYNQPISFDDGQAEKTFTINLDPRTATVSNYNPAPPPPPQPQSQPQAVSHPAPPRPAPPQPSGGDTSAPSGGEAFLNINSIPASSIVLDGKPIGNTPKLKYPVSAGSHTVLFVNTEQSFKKVVTVSVGAGETKPAIGKGD